MALSVQIPKEILDYKPKTIFGFTNRQFISIICLIFILGGSFFLQTKLKLSSDLISYIIIVFGLPIVAYGFFKPQGYLIEEYLKIIIAHRFKPYQLFNSNYKNVCIKKSKHNVPENYGCIPVIDIKGQKRRFKKQYKSAKKDFKKAKKIQKRMIKLERKEKKISEKSKECI